MAQLDPNDRRAVENFMTHLRNKGLGDDQIKVEVGLATGKRGPGEPVFTGKIPSPIRHKKVLTEESLATATRLNPTVEGKKQDKRLLLEGGLLGMASMSGAGVGRAVLGKALFNMGKGSRIPIVSRALKVAGPSIGAGAGEGLATYGAARALGMDHETARNISIFSGGVGLTAELAATVGGRSAGIVGNINVDTIDELMTGTNKRARFLSTPLSPEEASLRSRGVVGKIQDFESEIPQLRIPKTTDDAFELGMEKAVARQSQEIAFNTHLFSQQEAAIAAKRAAGTVKKQLVGGQKVIASQAKSSAERVRDRSIGFVGRGIDDALHEAERTMTAGALGKRSLLQEAEAAGVQIDGMELLKQIDDLIPEHPVATGAVAVDKKLSDLSARLKDEFGVFQPATVWHNKKLLSITMTPTQADDVLRQIREVSGAFGAIDDKAISVAHKNLSHFWRGHLYDSIAGTGPQAAAARQMLNSQEELRKFISVKNPHEFVSRIIAGGPGANDRLAALAKYEQLHGTNNLFRQSIEDIGSAYGSKLRDIGLEFNAASVRVNKFHDERITSIGRIDHAATQKLQQEKNAALAKLDRQFNERLNQVRIKDALTHDNLKGAFDLQKSTALEQAKFEAAQNLRGQMNIQKPSEFLNKFQSGHVDPDALNALRDFEGAAGTKGLIERELKDMAMRNELTKPERVLLRSIHYMIERLAARPAARIAGQIRVPVGNASAGLAAFLRTQELQEKKGGPLSLAFGPVLDIAGDLIKSRAGSSIRPQR